MKRFFFCILSLVLLVGCQGQDVSHFWDTHSIDYSDILAAEDQFAIFAEKAVAAPEADALTAMDGLFDHLLRDTVGYYIYSDWMDAAFYNLLSPCRNAPLYSKAVERMVTDGILNASEYGPFLQRRDWIQYNLAGGKATVPGLSDFDVRTLVLVLDKSCPSCREALERMAADPQWDGAAKVAVCLGFGPNPTVPGWEYLSPENAMTVFDIHLTPVYFVVSADGTVEIPYQLAL